MAHKAGKASQVAPPDTGGLWWVPAGVTQSNASLEGKAEQGQQLGGKMREAQVAGEEGVTVWGLNS